MRGAQIAKPSSYGGAANSRITQRWCRYHVDRNSIWLHCARPREGSVFSLTENSQMNRKIASIPVAILSALAVLLPHPAVSASAPDLTFPLRWEYPEEHFLSTQQFYKLYPNAIVVDSRTDLEWEALRVKGARLDSVDHVNRQMQYTFDSNLRQIESGNPGYRRPTIFYCNGTLCPKSYQATLKAIKMGVKNVYEYDSGILPWAMAHPAHTMAFGKPLTEGRLIPHKEFLAHTLSPKSFDMLLKTKPCHCFILDIRDFVTRDINLYPGREHYVSLDDPKRFDYFLNRAMREHRTLFIYDAVGKETPFVQYYLKQRNIHHYWFLRGGEAAWIKQGG